MDVIAKLTRKLLVPVNFRLLEAKRDEYVHCQGALHVSFFCRGVFYHQRLL